MQQYGGTILYIVLLFGLLYFLMIRPQQQRQKKHMQMLRSIKVNDRIVTAGGVFGNVVKVKEETLMLRIADGVRIEVLKSAIGEVREAAPEVRETGSEEEVKE